MQWGGKTALECALEDCETDENLIFDNTQEPNNEETNIDFLAQEAPAETSSLRENLSGEAPLDVNSSQAAAFEGEPLQKETTDVSEVKTLQEEPAERSSTLELPTAAADGAGGSETAEPESGLTLAEWNYTEENGGIVLTSLKDSSAKNVVVPGEFTDAPGKQVYIRGSKTKYPKYSASLEFREIDGKKVKVSDGSLSAAFETLTYLESFNGSGLDTSGVTDLSYTFAGTGAYNASGTFNITGLGDWDTSAVRTMSYMFDRCDSLKSLENSGMENWCNKVQELVTVEGMFSACQKLKNVKDISRWKTLKLVTMTKMFDSCYDLENIDWLKDWDVSKVTNMTSAFYCCNLNDVSPLENWNTKEVTRMVSMFSSCKINFADLSRWDLSSGGRNVEVDMMFRPRIAGDPLLVISPEEKLKNYNYAGDSRTPVGPKFDANDGKFPETSAGKEEEGISTQADGEVSADGSEIRQGKTTYWLKNNNTAVDEFISTAIEQPARDDGLVFCGWEPQDLPENPNAYDRMTATYKAKWGTLKINAPDREIEHGSTFDPLDGVTAEDGNGDPIPADQNELPKIVIRKNIHIDRF